MQRGHYFKTCECQKEKHGSKPCWIDSNREFLDQSLLASKIDKNDAAILRTFTIAQPVHE